MGRWRKAELLDTGEEFVPLGGGRKKGSEQDIEDATWTSLVMMKGEGAEGMKLFL